MELGWRIGMHFEGVGFPGHFLVRLAGEESDLLLDPFDHGSSVAEDDCRRMIAASSQGALHYEPEMARSIGKRDMVARLLLNLKVARLREKDLPGALLAVEQLLLVFPDSPPNCATAGCCSTSSTAIARRSRRSRTTCACGPTRRTAPRSNATCSRCR